MFNLKLSPLMFSSAKMALATLMSRVLGLVRELSMAFVWGAKGASDAYFVAFRIPNMLRDLLAEGAFSNSFVPEFTEAKLKGEDFAWALVKKVMLMGLIGITFTFIFFFFSEELIALFAPEFDFETSKMAVSLLKIMSPYLFFVMMAALLMGCLNTYKVFFIPALSPVFFNLVMIFSILVLPSILGLEGKNKILALGLGVAVGGLFQVLIQVPHFFKKVKGKKSNLDTSMAVSKIFRNLGPALLSQSVLQLNLVVTTILASGIEGAVSWINYSFRLFQLPIGLIGVSLANSNTVFFSKSWRSKDLVTAREILRETLIKVVYFALPISFFIQVRSESIVSIVYKRGAFDLGDVRMVAKLLEIYSLSLIFYILHKVIVPLFYVLNRPKMPFYSSIFSVAINITVCLVFVKTVGVSVFAIAPALSIFVNVSILSIFLYKDLSRKVILDFLKQVGKSLFSCAFIYIPYVFFSFYIEKIPYPFIKLALEGCFFVLLYALVMRLLREKSNKK